jgi:hypothetical protein
VGSFAKQSLCHFFLHDVVPEKLLVEILCRPNLLALRADYVRKWPLELYSHINSLLPLSLQDCPSVDLFD